MKSIICKANKKTRIIDNFGAGIPKTFAVSICPINDETLAGTFIEKRYFWVFPQKHVTGALQSTMKFNRYWINAIYKVDIKPNCDVKVVIE